MQLAPDDDIPVMTTTKEGAREWRDKAGEYHRLDGPAVEDPDLGNGWYTHGKLDRKYGPAVELNDGTRHWYRADRKHREDGPAVENPDGSHEYWLEGVQLEPAEYVEEMLHRGMEELRVKEEAETRQRAEDAAAAVQDGLERPLRVKSPFRFAR